MAVNKKENQKPCQKCGSTNIGREKTYQDFKDTKTGKIKEIHTAYLYYCKDCVNRSMKALKYKEKIWECLDKIKELEGQEGFNRFLGYIAEKKPKEPIVLLDEYD